MQRRGHHASGGSTSDQQNLQDTRAHQWTSQSQMSHNVNIDQHQRLTNTLHDSSLDQAFDFSASREERRRQGSVLSLTPSLRDGQIHFSTDGAWMSRTAVLPEGDLDLEPVTNEELEAFLSGNPWNVSKMCQRCSKLTTTRTSHWLTTFPLFLPLLRLEQTLNLQRQLVPTTIARLHMSISEGHTRHSPRRSFSLHPSTTDSICQGRMEVRWKLLRTRWLGQASETLHLPRSH